MKKIWYARDGVDGYLFPCCISEKEPEILRGYEEVYDSCGYVESFQPEQFKALFGFTPRPGEKGQLEIKRVKLSKQSGKEPGKEREGRRKNYQ